MANIKKAIKTSKTPFYLYDSSLIKKKYEELRRGLPREMEVFYAVKANPNKKIVSLIGSLGAGCDVASSGELVLALKSGIDPRKISFAGPGKTTDDLEYAIRKNIFSISAESLDEIYAINELSRKLRKITGVSIRINPAFGSFSAGLRMGGGSQQFGIDEEIVPQVVRTVKDCRSLNFLGIHMHTGSQILSEETIAGNIRYLIDFCVKLQNESGARVRYVNFGGGLGIPYHGGQKSLDIKKLGRLVNDAFQRTHAGSQLNGARYVMEPGRYMVGEAGVYVTKVLYKKESRGRTFLIVDGGMHQNSAAAGLLGEGIRRNRVIGVVPGRRYKGKEVVTIAGCLCTPLDIMARDITLPVCSPGDRLYITCSGAYGYSASPLAFLSHRFPVEAVV